MEILSTNLKFLKILGIGLSPDNRSFLSILCNILIITLDSVFVFGLIFSIHKCGAAFACIMDVALHTTFTIVTLQMYVTLLSSSGQCARIVTNLSELIDRHETQEFSSKGDKSFSKVLWCLEGLACATILHYNTLPLLNYSSCVENNSEPNPRPCGLPQPVFLPFEYDYFPVYHIMYAAEFFTGVSVAFILLNVSAFCCGITQHVISQLRSLCSNLRKTMKVGKSGRVDGLVGCIRHHAAVLE